MSFDVNQFAPTDIVGRCLNPAYGQRIEAEYFGSTAINVCAPCKFVAGTSPVNVSVDKISADTELPTAGILIYDSSKRNTYNKGQYVTLARVGSIIGLEASVAITADQKISITADGKAAASTATKNVIGIAMNSADKNAAVRVLLVEPYIATA